ncbi:MAG: hypothetical protein ABIU84_16435, partial [Thermoanaerobaculia bacterium]
DEFALRLPAPVAAPLPSNPLPKATPPHPTLPKIVSAEICLKLVNPKSLAWVVENCGSVVLREGKVSAFLVDLDQIRRADGGFDALQVPTRGFERGDWIRAGAGLGPYGIGSLPAVKSVISSGHRVAGYISVDCPECRSSRTYWVYWVVGHDGWYSEIPNGRSVSTGALGKSLAGLVSSPEQFFTGIPAEARRPIAENF